MAKTMTRKYKCWYSNCPHGGKVQDDEAVKHDKKRYHKDCYSEFVNLKKVRELYFEYIDKTVIWAQFNKVVNGIIKDKGVSSEYLLFALEYAIARKIEIKYPASLYYLVNNYTIKKAYENSQLLQEEVIYS